MGKSLIALSVDLLGDFLKSHGYIAPQANGELAILGFRGAVPDGDGQLAVVPNVPDINNDTIVVYGRTKTGEPIMHCYKGTVDPGAHYTNNVLNPKGCAHLMNGQYKYQFGTHKGHRAVTQYGKVKIWRDTDKDFNFDPADPIEEGFYGINIHAGSVNDRVGPWSAGCTNIQGGWQGQSWLSFMEVLKQHSPVFFWYTVADAAELLNFALTPKPEQPSAGQIKDHMDTVTEAQRVLYLEVRQLGLNDPLLNRAIAGMNEFNRVLVDAGLKPRS